MKFIFKIIYFKGFFLRINQPTRGNTKYFQFQNEMYIVYIINYEITNKNKLQPDGC